MAVFDYQSISTDEVRDLARLANAAYSGVGPPADWTALTGTMLGLDYSGTAYEAGPAAASVFVSDGTLVVSFRGTDQELADAITFFEIAPTNNTYLVRFNPLLNAVAAYIQDEANGITDVQVTGHSLGGATANLLRNVAANSYDGVFDDADFVTFASPTMSSDSSILNFGFMNDFVFKAFHKPGFFSTVFGTGPTEFFASATDRVVWYNDNVAANVQANSNIRSISEFLGGADSNPHSIVNYIDAMDRIIASEFYGETTRDMTILISETEHLVAPIPASIVDNAGPVLIVGNSALDDALQGSGSNDFIEGHAGHDFLWGMDGSDRMSGGFGNDEFVGGRGADTIDGGIGRDVVFFSDSGSGISADLSQDGTNVSGGRGADQLISIEEVVGSNFNDILIGDEADNLLYGGNGQDRILGGAGNDTVMAGGGTDTLFGGEGRDVLDAGIATSAILTGGTDADSFVFQSPGGSHLITDYDDAEDFIIINSFLPASFSDLNVTQIGASTLITLGSLSITLSDTNATDIDAGDVVLV